MIVQYLVRLMQANDTPTEQFERVDLVEAYHAFTLSRLGNACRDRR